ncbi:eukaryotic peptide chain release factor subunit 1 [Rozella allomycis CSF55]|uniref:Eukaryotic peptide chain release factor subunit 1 n=1 Tax=Rozella allomycis (strain CSF55) TaxID=988480 RepID=A0A075B2N1_ROZAC|nr:Eukaryotic peptide chain release factor subunit 1 [Rozella allomycis CSF55]RKP20761.1 eukaryotic peptide chain release factor subunit 1 [Rozella allomycis CSF55]|eukprot:EPZ36582.1 Eukaryotic peptide chain release factor subunit 1 [Rozella allomycis CSF55]
MADNTDEQNIEMWKIRKLIKNLNDAKGAGTSMISLILPPKDQVSRAQKMLTDEYGTASNIKSRVNRQSVLSAITSVQQRLKLYKNVPTNGLVLYCGTVLTEDGKEKKVSIDFEPFKPINTSLYLCDNKFHTEPLSELLESDAKFGFIVMDGNGVLFGALTGNTREVIHRLQIDLPKKHGRGGQSALRFARLRTEKRANYVRKVAELATQFFITNDRPNVAGLVLAGSADFKTDLKKSDLFDQRLQPKVVAIVDVQYGGEDGFNQAINLSQEVLSNVKFIKEKKLLEQFFELISQGQPLISYGLSDTYKALEMGAVETLIVWENLDIMRVTLRNSQLGTEKVVHLTKEQELVRENFMENGQELDVVDRVLFVEWLTQSEEGQPANYKQFGATLQFVSDKSQYGSQFVKGFSGVGAILRYSVDFMNLQDQGDFLEDDDDYDDYY